MTISLVLALASLTQSAHPAPPAPARIDARVAVSGAGLALTLALPPRSPGQRVAAVVLLPGSGCLVRGQSQAFADAFLRAGFAVVSFDKRGCGASTGSWLRASLDDMAADGRAIFDWLKDREEIDPKRAGIVGVSQGGWVGPLVVSARPEAAFFIGLTGGGVSPRAIEEFDYDRKLQHAGVVGADLAEARKAVATYLAYLAGDVPRAEIAGLLEAGKTRPWYKVLGLHRVMPDESFREAWAWVPRMDPIPALQAMKLPVLALIGGLDRDPAAEVKAWQAGLARNASPRTEIRVFPGSGHVLTVGDQHKEGAFNVEALDAMAAWAATVAGVRTSRDPASVP